MRIAFDATTFELTKGGTTVYLYNLLKNLKSIDPSNEYLSYGAKLFKQNSSLQKKINTIYRETAWRQYSISRRARNDGINILHFPNHYSTIYTRIPTVVTFHDIYILKNSDAFPIGQVMYSKFLIPMVLDKCTKIITVSNFTKNEILHSFEIPFDKIDVIHNGVGESFEVIKDEELLEMIRRKYNMPQKFILYVGAIEPRKNVDKLIDAMQLVRKEREIDLVIVSHGGWKNEFLLNRIKQNNSFIHFLGFVEDSDLPLIYNLADLFIYPSSYEGFGLPILEALACGVQVVASDIEVFKEIIGTDGIFCNPFEIQKFSEIILNTLEKTNKDDIITNATTIQKKFSWEKCAMKTLEFYNSILT
ncbi:MAG: group 1 glycosyl transferase [Ignavibacteria bacterium]|nr:MAG: group 1 glycosyl transferase [Ignavibacteria bacterium]KAF0158548.1 MAG: group 1 glycosyl transferase [Ignavibacteria bacterium]